MATKAAYVSKTKPGSGRWFTGKGLACWTEREYGVPALSVYQYCNPYDNLETSTTLPKSGISMLLLEPSAVRQACLLLKLVEAGWLRSL